MFFLAICIVFSKVLGHFSLRLLVYIVTNTLCCASLHMIISYTMVKLLLLLTLISTLIVEFCFYLILYLLLLIVSGGGQFYEVQAPSYLRVKRLKLVSPPYLTFFYFFIFILRTGFI